MTLENISVVDAAGVDKNTGELVLSILDSWGWEDELNHLTAMQSKINTYLDFVESEQVFEVYPEAKGRTIRINIVSRYPAPQSCMTLLEKAVAVSARLNISITHQNYPGA